jgi:uncharacterized membrane protein
MRKQYSDRLVAASSRTDSHPRVETSAANPEKNIQTKEYTSVIIGWILRGGVILSATIILIGLLLLVFHPGGLPQLAVSLRAFPHTMQQVWSGLLVLRPQAVIALGLLLLIVTPVITVITSVVAFALERDPRSVAIALVVLAILIMSLLIAKGGG